MNRAPRGKRRSSIWPPATAKPKLGCLWACARPGGDTVFAWHTSRAATCIEGIIPFGFGGTAQCDAYAAFVRSHNASAGCEAITLASCWAHARRGFSEARESEPRTAGWLLRQIAALCPELRAGDMVIMDNLAPHKSDPTLAPAALNYSQEYRRRLLSRQKGFGFVL